MRLFLFLVATAFLSACSVEHSHSDEMQGFIRLPAPGAAMTAAYLTVQSDSDDRVVAVSVEGAARTEMHIAFEEDGINRMRQVDGYDLEAGEPLSLRPGAEHLMVMGLDDGFVEGAMRTVTVTFESGKVQEFELPVQRGVGRHSGH